ncbi:DnaJ domain-containing protein [Neisseria sp. HMSC069H12]|uniref:DnaJ domain-containing protein n=1 Tax=Neisseria sp. HMSC069H12 TaxID=1739376 RepID=UPI0008A3A959|nr:DnaJ domain-containing protein [Neisseria sp. HMSC069H12]OFR68469.1 molecular chaperone DnaJ [Neisseria sp. HMSC069H12]
MEQVNLYEVLGVSQDADINVIREAYGKLVANPDIQKDAERFKAIGQAFEVLSHPEKRLAYDAAMQYERQGVKDNSFNDTAANHTANYNTESNNIESNNIESNNTAANVVNTSNSEVKNYVFIAYVTYALGLLILFTPVIGVILAFIKRDEAQGSIYASHIDWLIKTFWVSLIGLLLGRLTILILIGWLILLVTAIWFIYRVVIGLIKLNEDKPVSTQGWF